MAGTSKTPNHGRLNHWKEDDICVFDGDGQVNLLQLRAEVTADEHLVTLYITSPE